jgi:cupin 2 domain-containing protein
MSNIFSELPADLDEEIFQDILKTANVRIERIISRGHSSPADGWYDQEEDEWVIVLEGSAVILMEEGNREVHLEKGDYLNIPAHARHKVLWTAPDQLTIWLAVFYLPGG